jgi:hypothetical protein
VQAKISALTIMFYDQVGVQEIEAQVIPARSSETVRPLISVSRLQMIKLLVMIKQCWSKTASTPEAHLSHSVHSVAFCAIPRRHCQRDVCRASKEERKGYYSRVY